MRLTYIPFSEELVKALSEKTISDEFHRLLIAEGCFLPEGNKIAMVNPDSSIAPFI